MVLEFEGNAVRMVGTQDHPQWVAADVCRILGITNPSNVMTKFRGSERGIHTMYTPQGGSQEMLTVTEPGLYRLILKSRKPDADRFRVWLTHDVLPCIRKHGCYPAPEVAVRSTALVKIDEEALGRAIGRELNTFVTPQFDRLNRRVDNLEYAVNSIARRANLSDKTKSLHVRICHTFFGGRCPCCALEQIVNANGERLDSVLQFDHWTLRTQNGADHTWPVCASCNSKLRSQEFKADAKTMFEAYQTRLRQFVRMMDPDRRQMRLEGF
jgi:prophage antirepressor-like protein